MSFKSSFFSVFFILPNINGTGISILSGTFSFGVYIENYKEFTISMEEKQEIYEYALKLKEELQKLKIEYDPHAK
jgi:hypothetical protein